MNSKEFSKKYKIDQEKFEEFVRENELYTTIGWSSYELKDIDEYTIIEAFKEGRKISKSLYDDKEISNNDGFDDEETVIKRIRNSNKNRKYIVQQVTLKNQMLSTGSSNLYHLENVINAWFENGYRLHSFSTAEVPLKGFAVGERIQATMVFERID